jgi:3-deoxy-7-phosphoheptulonate synthase
MSAYFPILSPAKLKASFPISQNAERFIYESRLEIKNLLQNRGSKAVFVVGPCSIHDQKGILEYAKKIKELSFLINQTSLIVMRAYIEKSRTQTGWKGIVYDPFLDGSNDLKAGISISRQILVELCELEIPLAVEIVDPLVFSYFDDLVSWGFIGARTASSQVHRQFVSTLPFPVGFKNALDGDTLVAFQSIKTARQPQTFLGSNPEGVLSTIKSNGNPFTHLVLRGTAKEPNYTSHIVKNIFRSQEASEIYSPILIDCAHGNSQKIPANQAICFENVLEQMLKKNHHILGMMLESYTKWGNQEMTFDNLQKDPDISVTDPCINFETTRKLLLSADQLIKSKMMVSF